MVIPKPPLSGHLSPTPPHQHALPLPNLITLSLFYNSFFPFLFTHPSAALDAFRLAVPTPLFSSPSTIFKLPHCHLFKYLVSQEANRRKQPVLLTTVPDHHTQHRSLRSPISSLNLIMDSSFLRTSTTETTTSTSTSFNSTPTPSSTSDYNFPPNEGLQLQYAFPLQQAGPSLAYPAYPFVLGGNPHPYFLPILRERSTADAWASKVARHRRRMARQRSLSLARSSASWATSTTEQTRGPETYSTEASVHKSNNIVSKDSHTFCTPDDKRLRVLLKKQLKSSDIGPLGRIVLPKKEAEENLPLLSDKDGIEVMIRDVYTQKEWIMKYKYWSNNKSRMYVLDNAVDFVRESGLVLGDSITLYEDECKNLYVSIERAERAVHSTSNTAQSSSYSYNFSNPFVSFAWEVSEEEEASLQLLIEQLRHGDDQEDNSLACLSMESAPSYK